MIFSFLSLPPEYRIPNRRQFDYPYQRPALSMRALFTLQT